MLRSSGSGPISGVDRGKPALRRDFPSGTSSSVKGTTNAGTAFSSLVPFSGHGSIGGNPHRASSEGRGGDALLQHDVTRGTLWRPSSGASVLTTRPARLFTPPSGSPCRSSPASPLSASMSCTLELSDVRGSLRSHPVGGGVDFTGLASRERHCEPISTVATLSPPLGIQKRELGARLVARRRNWGSLETSWLVKNAFAEWRGLLRSSVRAQVVQAADLADIHLINELQRTIVQKDAHLVALEKRFAELLESEPKLRRHAAVISADGAARLSHQLESRALLHRVFTSFERFTVESRLEAQITRLEERLHHSEKRFEELNDVILQLRAQLSQSEDELRRSQASILESDVEATRLHESLNENERRLYSSDEQLQASSELVLNLKEQLRDNEIRLRSSEELLRESKEGLTQLQTQVQENEELLRCSEERYTESQANAAAQIFDYQNRCRSLEELLRESRGGTQQFNEQLLEAAQTKRLLEERLLDSDKKIKWLEADAHNGVQKRENQLIESNEKAKKLEEQLHDYQHRCQNFNELVHESSRGIETLQEQLSESEGKRKRLEEQLHALEHRSNDQINECQERLRGSEELLRQSQEQIQDMLCQRQHDDASNLRDCEERLRCSTEVIRQKDADNLLAQDQLRSCEALLQQRDASLTHSFEQLRGYEEKLRHASILAYEKEEELSRCQAQVLEYESRLQYSEERLTQAEADSMQLQKQLTEAEACLANVNFRFLEAETKLRQADEDKSRNAESFARELARRRLMADASARFIENAARITLAVCWRLWVERSVDKGRNRNRLQQQLTMISMRAVRRRLAAVVASWRFSLWDVRLEAALNAAWAASESEHEAQAIARIDAQQLNLEIQRRQDDRRRFASALWQNANLRDGADCARLVLLVFSRWREAHATIKWMGRAAMRTLGMQRSVCLHACFIQWFRSASNAKHDAVVEKNTWEHKQRIHRILFGMLGADDIRLRLGTIIKKWHLLLVALRRARAAGYQLCRASSPCLLSTIFFAWQRSWKTQVAEAGFQQLRVKLADRGVSIMGGLLLKSQARSQHAFVFFTWYRFCIEMRFLKMQKLITVTRYRGAQISEKLVTVGQLWLLLADVISLWRLATRCHATRLNDRDHFAQLLVTVHATRWLAVAVVEWRAAVKASQQSHAKELAMKAMELERSQKVSVKLLADEMRERGLKVAAGLASSASQKEICSKIWISWKLAFLELKASANAQRCSEAVLEQRIAIEGVLNIARFQNLLVRVVSSWRVFAVICRGVAQVSEAIQDTQALWRAHGAGVSYTLAHVGQLRLLMHRMLNAWLQACEGPRRLRAVAPVLVWARTCQWVAAILAGWIRVHTLALWHRSIDLAESDRRWQLQEHRLLMLLVTDTIIGRSKSKACLGSTFRAWHSAAEMDLALRRRALSVFVGTQPRYLLANIYGEWVTWHREQKTGRLAEASRFAFGDYLRKRNADISIGLIDTGQSRLTCTKCFSDWKVFTLEIRLGRQAGFVLLRVHTRLWIAALLAEWRRLQATERSGRIAAVEAVRHNSLLAKLRSQHALVTDFFTQSASTRLWLTDLLINWTAVASAAKTRRRFAVQLEPKAHRFILLRIFGLWSQALLASKLGRSAIDTRSACNELIQRIKVRGSEVLDRTASRLQALQTVADVLSFWHVAAQNLKIFALKERSRDLERSLQQRGREIAHWFAARGCRQLQQGKIFVAWRCSISEGVQKRYYIGALASGSSRYQARRMFEQWVRVMMTSACHNAVKSKEEAIHKLGEHLRHQKANICEWFATAGGREPILLSCFTSWRLLLKDTKLTAMKELHVLNLLKRSLTQENFASKSSQRMLICDAFACWKQEWQGKRLMTRNTTLFISKSSHLLLGTLLQAWSRIVTVCRSDEAAQRAQHMLKICLISRGAEIANRLELRAQLRLLLVPLLLAWLNVSMASRRFRVRIGLFLASGDVRAWKVRLVWEWRHVVTSCASQNAHEVAISELNARLHSRGLSVGEALAKRGHQRLALMNVLIAWKLKLQSSYAKRRAVLALSDGCSRGLRAFAFKHWHEILASTKSATARQELALKRQFQSATLMAWHAKNGSERFRILYAFAAWQRSVVESFVVRTSSATARDLTAAWVQQEESSKKVLAAAILLGSTSLLRMILAAWSRRTAMLRALLREHGLRETMIETWIMFSIFMEWRLQANVDLWTQKQQEMAALLAQAGAQLMQASAKEVQQGRMENNARQAMRRVATKIIRLHWSTDVSRVFGLWSKSVIEARWERRDGRRGEELTARWQDIRITSHRLHSLKESAATRCAIARQVRQLHVIWASWLRLGLQTRAADGHEELRRHIGRHARISKTGVALTLLARARGVYHIIFFAWKQLSERGQHNANIRALGARLYNSVITALDSKSSMLTQRVLLAWASIVIGRRARFRRGRDSSLRSPGGEIQDKFLLRVVFGAWLWPLVEATRLRRRVLRAVGQSVELRVRTTKWEILLKWANAVAKSRSSSPSRSMSQSLSPRYIQAAPPPPPVTYTVPPVTYTVPTAVIPTTAIATSRTALSPTRRQQCVCGNTFMEDANFCRKCGLARPVMRPVVTQSVAVERSPLLSRQQPEITNRILYQTRSLSPARSLSPCGVRARVRPLPPDRVLTLDSPQLKLSRERSTEPIGFKSESVPWKKPPSVATPRPLAHPRELARESSYAFASRPILRRDSKSTRSPERTTSQGQPGADVAPLVRFSSIDGSKNLDLPNTTQDDDSPLFSAKPAWPSPPPDVARNSRNGTQASQAFTTQTFEHRSHAEHAGHKLSDDVTGAIGSWAADAASGTKNGDFSPVTLSPSSPILNGHGHSQTQTSLGSASQRVMLNHGRDLGLRDGRGDSNVTTPQVVTA